MPPTILLINIIDNYHLHTPFQTLLGSTARAFNTIVNVDNPQNAGSSCVRNCSARRKYTSRVPS